MINPAWAQAAQGTGGAPPVLAQLPMFAAIGAVMYFLLFRPQQQKAKELRLMLANLKRNDEVVTAGGLYGKVIALTDKVVTLEIAPNVRVRVDRTQIAAMANGARGGASPDDSTKDKEKEKAK